MSDIKLFQFNSSDVTELHGTAVQVEKSLQTTFEANLETLLGIRFLASEHSTGSVHGGRIDTLGLDEDNCPVIIEYKRAVNENVINQGLFYLDWLLDHRKEFQWLVMERLGPDVAKTVDWSAPRLLCIAGDFTRYDEHAVKQIARNIELIRYRQFSGDFLLLELVHIPKRAKVNNIRAAFPKNKSINDFLQSDDARRETGAPSSNRSLSYRLENSPNDLQDIYAAVEQFLTGLGDDIQIKELKMYTAFKRIRNFACMEIYPQTRTIYVYLKLDPDTVQHQEGFTRDLRNIGHFGTGDLQLSLKTMSDFEKAQPLFVRAYELS